MAGSAVLTVDARDVDTAAGELTFELQLNGNPVSASDYFVSYDGSILTYDVVWDTSAVPDGDYQRSVIGVDAQGNTSVSTGPLVTAELPVAIENIDDPPLVRMVDPLSNSQVGGVITLMAQIQDDRGMDQGSAEFTVQGDNGSVLAFPAQHSQGNLWTAIWDVRNTGAGNYTITITAQDGVNAPVEDVVTNFQASTSAGFYVYDISFGSNQRRGKTRRFDLPFTIRQRGPWCSLWVSFPRPSRRRLQGFR